MSEEFVKIRGPPNALNPLHSNNTLEFDISLLDFHLLNSSYTDKIVSSNTLIL